MSEIVQNDPDAQRLRQALHERIDRLSLPTLAAADRLLVQIELDQLRGELDSAFDRDQAESRLTPEKIGTAVALHRARHPYGG
jgi:hypothetical protein